MKFLSTLFCGLVAIRVQCNPVVTMDAADNLKALGYQISPLEFTGPVGPNGENVTLAGTVEEIFDQIIQFNPAYETPDFTSVRSRLANATSVEDGGKDKRTPIDPVYCNLDGYKKANYGRIEEGMAYLEKFGNGAGVCNAGEGPKNCVRISCSWNSGIFLCNDSPHRVDRLCRDILYGYIWPIHNRCTNENHDSFNGKRLDSDHCCAV
ncbi:hypothetical protein MPDQ_004451 [Monascus purpureus]|uniref:Secreted protein n=1 Tax=Monascus purpureus TaxID=5098 RepID=A0A507QXN5_MONPU|nr:hypothetical protein MPDQ_004451 [Monascus purpureus]